MGTNIVLTTDFECIPKEEVVPNKVYSLNSYSVVADPLLDVLGLFADHFVAIAKEAETSSTVVPRELQAKEASTTIHRQIRTLLSIKHSLSDIWITAFTNSSELEQVVLFSVNCGDGASDTYWLLIPSIFHSIVSFGRYNGFSIYKRTAQSERANSHDAPQLGTIARIIRPRRCDSLT